LICEGAASGIGFATAKILYQRGASLALCDIQKDLLDRVTPEIESLRIEDGQKITTLKVNVTSTEEVDQWIGNAIQDFGRLDGAANVAGTAITSGVIGETSDEAWERMMAINSTGT
jgi:NAD(P)-dependent dehydrogenase (short-subunit alcohol dehydrogenase family)